MFIRTGLTVGKSPRCKRMNEELADLDQRISGYSADKSTYIEKFGLEKYNATVDKLNAHRDMLLMYIGKDCVTRTE